MRKRLELSDLESCINRAAPDEHVFVLLGRDASAPTAIRHWANDRVSRGKNANGDAQIIEALRCADEMEEDRAGVLRVDARDFSRD